MRRKGKAMETVPKPFLKRFVQHGERNGNKNGFYRSKPFANGNDWSPTKRGRGQLSGKMTVETKVVDT
jgi:hypothetical protein